MSREPTEQQIEEKPIELAYTWGDIEEELDRMASRTDVEPDDALRNEAGWNAGCLDHAFRVEAVFDGNEWGDACSFYDVLFDVADRDAREGRKEP